MARTRAIATHAISVSILLTVTAACSSASPKPSTEQAQAFCAMVTQIRDRPQPTVGPDISPDSLRAIVKQNVDDAQRAAKQAPPDIQTDLQMLADAASAAASAYDKAGYDLSKLGPDANAAAKTPAAQAAQQHVQAYLSHNCHIGSPTASGQ